MAAQREAANALRQSSGNVRRDGEKAASWPSVTGHAPITGANQTPEDVGTIFWPSNWLYSGVLPVFFQN